MVQWSFIDILNFLLIYFLFFKKKNKEFLDLSKAKSKNFLI